MMFLFYRGALPILEKIMPYINVKITDENVTRPQKDALIAGITEVISVVLQKKPEYTMVVIEEIPTDNWGIGGQNYQDFILNPNVKWLLCSWDTSNGRKVAIMLEEIKLPYQYHPIDIDKRHQHSDDYLSINPNKKPPRSLIHRDQRANR